MIQDEFNRTRVYHGVNVVYKIPPYYPSQDEFNSTTSFNDDDARLLISNGMNVIRLYVSWEGTEPSRNQYNYTYLDQIKKIV